MQWCHDMWCREEQEIYLSQGKPVVVQPEGTETGEFVPKCKVTYPIRFHN